MNDDTRLDDLLVRWEERYQEGEVLSPEELCRDCPELLEEVRRQIEKLQRVKALMGFRTPKDNSTDQTEEYSPRSSDPTPPDRSAADSDFTQEHVSQTNSTGEFPSRIGRYVVEEKIGQGGMGAVLRVHDDSFDRTLAVKIMRPKGQPNSAAIQRFLAEAKLTGRLQHPGIPPVHELGELDGGLPFFAMKLIQGSTLSQLLEARDTPEQNLPRFVGIFGQICQTVAYAHSRGIIHRDLKPSNIMVGAFGEVQVMDWGLAKVVGDSSEREQATLADPETSDSEQADDLPGLSSTGDIMGTPGYMAPEQARGEIRTLDPRADVFGLGAILYKILTGLPPFVGTGAREIALRAGHGDLREAFERLGHCGADPELVELAKRCLAANREERPQDGAEVAEAIELYERQVQERLRQAELERAEARVQAEEERKRRELETAKAHAERNRRRMTIVSLVMALLLVLGAGIAVIAYQQMQATAAAKQAEQERKDLAQKLKEQKRVTTATALVQQNLNEGLAKATQLKRQLSQEGGVTSYLDDRSKWQERLASIESRLELANNIQPTEKLNLES